MNFGQQCEAWSAEYATRILGWELVAQNQHFRHGELDLVLRNKQEWIFVEVKGRKSSHFGEGLEVLSKEKIRRLRFCIGRWLHQNAWAPWSLELWCVKPGPQIDRYPLI